MEGVIRIKTITELLQFTNRVTPGHPLISVVQMKSNRNPELYKKYFNVKFAADFYTIMYKHGRGGSLNYGRSSYDFEAGTLLFISPGQVISPSSNPDLDLKMHEGWMIFFDPKLIQNSSLGKNINQYTFFKYESNEALHISDVEKESIFNIVDMIKNECNQNKDDHSHQLLLSNLELFLNYCLRFYSRQFITRASINRDYVTTFENILNNYFNSDQIKEQGTPSISYFGEAMNMSSNYLSDLLKKETGKSIREYINEALMFKAKNILLNSNHSISQIAYELGFEYPQSFSRLFKSKTGLSPNNFRKTQ